MQHELINLSNNLQTLFVDAPGSTAASAQIWFRAGSALEKKENEGIAHFLEHMFFKGTEKRPGAAIAHEVESFGGEINAFTSFDYTCYYINTPNKNLETTTEILLDMVSNPLFRQDDLVPERGVVFEEFRRSIDNPGQYSFHKIQKASFTGGYAHPILGNEKTILSFSRDQLKDFRKNFYNLNNALLVIAGDLSKKESLIKSIESFKLPEGPRSKFPAFKLKQKSTIDIHQRDTNMVTLNLCIQAPDFEDFTAPAEDLAINCLSHGESSRLYQALVADTSIANSCGGSSMFMNHGGLHFLKFIFPPENTQKLFKALSTLLLKTIKGGFSDNEVQKIKNQYLASKVYDMESLESYAFSLGHSFASTGDINSEEEFIRKIRKTTTSEVNEALKGLFKKQIHMSLQFPKEVEVKSYKPMIAKFQKDFEKQTKLIKNNLSKLPAAKTSAFDPQVKLINLKPGINLVYRQNTMNPTFVLHAYLKGGITEEDHKNNGLYQLLSSVITKGYKGQDYLALRSELDFLSASLSSFSGKNAYGLTLHGQSEHFKKLTHHFCGTLLEPTFKAEHIKHEKEIVLRTIKNYQKDPIKQCFREVGEIFFNGHPYSMPIAGTEKSIKMISGKAIKERHQKNLKGKEILLTYCGDKSLQEVLDALEPIISSLPSRSKKTLNKKPVKPLKGVEKFIEIDREQTQIFYGIPSKPLGHKDNIALKFISTHLSGQSSELFVEVRDRQGLCYTAQPILFSALESGYFGIYMASGHDKVEPAIKAIKDIIQNLKDNGLSKKEFIRVKKMIAGQNLLNIQTNDDYANIYSVTTLQGKGLDYYHKSNIEIEDLKYEDFQSSLKKLFAQKWSSVVVGRKS